jgi:hypothetical protein
MVRDFAVRAGACLGIVGLVSAIPREREPEHELRSEKREARSVNCRHLAWIASETLTAAPGIATPAISW